MFLARSNPNEPSLLADFAASLTSASKEDLQQVLETVDLERRLHQVVELLHRELEIARAQMEIREHVEAEIPETSAGSRAAPAAASTFRKSWE